MIEIKKSYSTKGRKRHPTAKFRGVWTKEEDAALVRFVELLGHGNWSPIARALNDKMGKGEENGRIGKQCRERWNHHLAPDIKKDPWLDDEEELLARTHRSLGNKWSDIAKAIPGRSENSVKNHWNATLRRRDPAGTLPTPLKQYMIQQGLSSGVSGSPAGRALKSKRKMSHVTSSDTSCQTESDVDEDNGGASGSRDEPTSLTSSRQRSTATLHGSSSMPGKAGLSSRSCPSDIGSKRHSPAAELQGRAQPLPTTAGRGAEFAAAASPVNTQPVVKQCMNAAYATRPCPTVADDDGCVGGGWGQGDLLGSLQSVPGTRPASMYPGRMRSISIGNGSAWSAQPLHTDTQQQQAAGRMDDDLLYEVDMARLMDMAGLSSPLLPAWSIDPHAMLKDEDVAAVDLIDERFFGPESRSPSHRQGSKSSPQDHEQQPYKDIQSRPTFCGGNVAGSTALSCLGMRTVTTQAPVEHIAGMGAAAASPRMVAASPFSVAGTNGGTTASPYPSGGGTNGGMFQFQSSNPAEEASMPPPSGGAHLGQGHSHGYLQAGTSAAAAAAAATAGTATDQLLWGSLPPRWTPTPPPAPPPNYYHEALHDVGSSTSLETACNPFAPRQSQTNQNHAAMQEGSACAEPDCNPFGPRRSQTNQMSPCGSQPQPQPQPQPAGMWHQGQSQKHMEDWGLVSSGVRRISSPASMASGNSPLWQQQQQQAVHCGQGFKPDPDSATWQQQQHLDFAAWRQQMQQKLYPSSWPQQQQQCANVATRQQGLQRTAAPSLGGRGTAVSGTPQRRQLPGSRNGAAPGELLPALQATPANRGHRPVFSQQPLGGLVPIPSAMRSVPHQQDPAGPYGRMARSTSCYHMDSGGGDNNIPGQLGASRGPGAGFEGSFRQAPKLAMEHDAIAALYADPQPSLCCADWLPTPVPSGALKYWQDVWVHTVISGNRVLITTQQLPTLEVLLSPPPAGQMQSLGGVGRAEGGGAAAAQSTVQPISPNLFHQFGSMGSLHVCLQKLHCSLERCKLGGLSLPSGPEQDRTMSALQDMSRLLHFMTEWAIKAYRLDSMHLAIRLEPKDGSGDGQAGEGRCANQPSVLVAVGSASDPQQAVQAASFISKELSSLLVA